MFYGTVSIVWNIPIFNLNDIIFHIIQSIPPDIVMDMNHVMIEAQWSRALSLMCEVALNARSMQATTLNIVFNVSKSSCLAQYHQVQTARVDAPTLNASLPLFVMHQKWMNSK